MMGKMKEKKGGAKEEDDKIGDNSEDGEEDEGKIRN